MTRPTLEQIDRLVGQADPLPPGLPERWAASPAAEHTLRRIVATGPEHPVRAPHRRRRWVLAPAAAFAAVIAVALVLVPGRADPAVAATLERAAVRAATATPLGPPPPGRYLYTRTEALQEGAGDGFAWRVPVTHQTWTAADGSGRLRVTYGEPRFLTPGDQRNWESAGRPRFIADSDERLGPGEAAGPSSTVAGLPADPDVLERHFQRKALSFGRLRNEQLFVLVTDVLREPGVDAAMRAALYRVLARVPGVELAGPVTLPGGRTGTAVGLTAGDTRREMIFEPGTGETLGERDVLVAARDGQPAGTVGMYDVVVAREIVGSVTATR
jgi:hypothetical protein